MPTQTPSSFMPIWPSAPVVVKTSAAGASVGSVRSRHHVLGRGVVHVPGLGEEAGAVGTVVGDDHRGAVVLHHGVGVGAADDGTDGVDEVGESADHDRLGRRDARGLGHGAHLGIQRGGVGLVGGEHRRRQIEHIGSADRSARPQPFHHERNPFLGVPPDLLGVGRAMRGAHLLGSPGDVEDTDRRSLHVSHCRRESDPAQPNRLPVVRLWC